MPTRSSLADIRLYKEPKDVWLSMGEKTWPNPQNNVATVYFNAEHQLEPFVGRIGGVSCRKSRLTANTIRFHTIGKNRAPTAQSFASGMVVLMGATSERTTLHYIHILRFMFMNMKLKRMPRNGRMLVRNRVCSGFYGFGLDIENFEPEDRVGIVRHNPSFPGIVYTTKPPGTDEPISLSLFKSGKLIIMGLGPKEARQVYGHVLPVLERNRLQGNNTRSKTTRSITAIKEQLAQRPTTKKTYQECVRDALDSVTDYDPNDPLEAYYHQPIFDEQPKPNKDEEEEDVVVETFIIDGDGKEIDHCVHETNVMGGDDDEEKMDEYETFVVREEGKEPCVYEMCIVDDDDDEEEKIVYRGFETFVMRDEKEEEEEEEEKIVYRDFETFVMRDETSSPAPRRQAKRVSCDTTLRQGDGKKKSRRPDAQSRHPTSRRVDRASAAQRIDYS